MIPFACIVGGVLLVWSILVVLIVRHERDNAAREAVFAHRICVILDGQMIVNATVGMLRHHEVLRGRKFHHGETVILLGEPVPAPRTLQLRR